MNLSGALLFARYAFPPNALGLCGPDDHQALLEHADTGTVDGGLVQIAKGFLGAWPYLELIAGANRITDPLDASVVEAYWLGNRLVRCVRPADVARHAEDRFRRVAGPDLGSIMDAVRRGVPVTHGFHVFAVYPWVGLLRQGRDQPALHVLDQCRISWGQVIELDGDSAVVLTPRLVRTDRGIELGSPGPQSFQVARDGASLAHGLSVGEWVSLHWDWVCDRLTRHQLVTLHATTAADLDSANVALSQAAACLG